ncbi:MAG: hypothetical protein J6Q53_04755 [Oscillospiraceae bacterium]|nr:hypothetical protein [Oscillospiraceae bacterium]
MLHFLTHASAASAAAAENAQLVFDPAKFIRNLQYMGIGMLVIFLVIGVIILSTMLVNYLFSDPTN